MNQFLLIGLAIGFISILVYIARFRKQPDIGIVLEILISAVGASSGLKICRYAMTEEFSKALKTIPNMSQDDGFYFLLGGVALLWISLQTIGRRIF